MESQIYLELILGGQLTPPHLTPQLLRYCYMTVLRYFNQFHCLSNELSVPYLDLITRRFCQARAFDLWDLLQSFTEVLFQGKESHAVTQRLRGYVDCSYSSYF